MERLENGEHLELLRGANDKLSRFFEQFSGKPITGTVEEVDALLAVEQALRSVGVLLDGRLQSNPDTYIQEELARYRRNLLRLRRELALMQQSAAACRTQLQARHQHLQAAQEWCAASQAAS
jgi:hypothetical protein